MLWLVQILLLFVPQPRIGEVAKGYTAFQVPGMPFQVDVCGFSHRIQFFRTNSVEGSFVLVHVSVATARAVTLSDFHKLIL
jgi:hypothetical protein